MQDDLSDIDKALVKASWAGDTQAAVDALDRGANINAGRGEPLRWAVAPNHIGLVRLLIDRGADIHLNDIKTIQNAVTANYIEIVSMFLKADPDIEHWSHQYLLGQAINYNFTPMTALLLERGAENPFNHYYEGGASISHHPKPETLVYAAPAIRKAIAKLPPREQKPASRIAWQRAAIAAELGETKDDVIKAAIKALQRDVIPSPRNSFKEIAARCGLRGYLATYDMHAMAQEYAEAILLPQLLLEAGVSGKHDKLSRIDPKELSENLVPIAGRILFADKTLEEALQLVTTYKRSGNAIPDKLRPLRVGRWQALIEKTETPFKYEGVTVTLEALTTPEALDNEGLRMNHCLTRSTEASDCCEGRHHILSIRAGDQILATITARIDERDGKLQLSSQGRNKGSTPAVANQIKEWFLKELRERRLSLNKPQDGHWGRIKTDEDANLPRVVERIGYYPERNQVEACLQHYRERLLLKEDKGIRGQPASQKNYKWRQAVSNQSLEQMIKNTGFISQWQSLVKSVQKTLDITPSSARRSDKKNVSISPS